MQARIAFAIFSWLIVCPAISLALDTEDFFSRKTEWRGFDQYHTEIAGRKAYVVVPTKAAQGNPWVWRARFPNYHSEMDQKLVERGFHIAYIDVSGMFGSPRAVAIWDKFYLFATAKLGLAKRPALEGVSRGGLMVYNWAAANTEKISCIYCDTPVCDFKSWPGGKGEGIGSASTWRQCLAEYDFDEEEAARYRHNPVDQAPAIAAAKIPILHIVSEDDRVVPPRENTYLLKLRLEEAGHTMEVISVAQGTAKSSGHHFNHPAVDQVVAFIERHTIVPAK